MNGFFHLDRIVVKVTSRIGFGNGQEWLELGFWELELELRFGIGIGIEKPPGSDLVVWGYWDPAMSSLFLHETELVCAVWPIAFKF